MSKDLPYWVATSAIPGVGTATFNYLLRRFKTLKAVWQVSDEKIRNLKVDSKTKEAILEFRQKVDPRVYLDTVYERGIKVVSVVDRTYPANLRKISDAPPVLYYKGTFSTNKGSIFNTSLRASSSKTRTAGLKGSLPPQDDLALAVVGARYCTAYGRQVTEKLVFDLVNAGLTIISGLARGIDSVAHRSALEAGGRTIAVLGSGIDVIYPPENKNLAGEIIKNGAVVSELPLGFAPKAANFPARNRIISGLALGVIVTEAAVDSGSLITAGCAAEQGREVFAVPGPINSKMSAGVNNLIKEGVHPVTDALDILEILDIKGKQKQIVTSNQRPETSKLDKEQRKILELLNGQSKHIDIIVRESGLAIDKVSAVLSVMEIRGLVKNYGSGIWGV